MTDDSVGSPQGAVQNRRHDRGCGSVSGSMMRKIDNVFSGLGNNEVNEQPFPGRPALKLGTLFSVCWLFDERIDILLPVRFHQWGKPCIGMNLPDFPRVAKPSEDSPISCLGATSEGNVHACILIPTERDWDDSGMEIGGYRATPPQSVHPHIPGGEGRRRPVGRWRH
jgi:hypothetical protein